VLLTGGPGSGKNAMCKKVLFRFPKAVHISMSEVLSKDSAAAKSLEAGDLVAPDVALNAALSALKEAKDAEVILLDGYPRTAQQVNDFNTSVSIGSLQNTSIFQSTFLIYRLVV
jgi:adenylate kinase family enzyme